MNFFPAEEFSNDRHFELEYETEIGHLFAGFNHVADDGQIEGRQQVARLIKDERGFGEGGSLAPLRDDGKAWLVCGSGWRRWGRPTSEKQTGNSGCYSLLRANERGNFSRQLFAQFAGSSRRDSGISAYFWHCYASLAC